MTANDTIRLLIVNDARTEVERLVSMLTNAGRSIRAQHADSAEALTKLLEEQSWDMLLAQSDSTNLPAAEAIRTINRLHRDVPVILISDNGSPQAAVEGMKMGARDVVQLDEDQHLLLVMQREQENREHRQQRRLADRKLRDAERRGQQLLDSSRDAIAFVQDGMFLYVNQSFAERFGYSDPDDMDCMPVIDMVADSDRDRVRQFLKNFAIKGDEAESCELDVQGLRPDGEACALSINVAMAMYDDEYCIQFQLPSSGAEAEGDNQQLQAQLQRIRDRDPLTDLYNRQYLTERLEQAISHSLDAETTSTLLYIELDGFYDQLQPRLGVARADTLLCAVARFLEQYRQDGETLARFSDNAFMLLSPGQSANTALQRAEALCQAAKPHFFDLGDTTTQATFSVGVAVVNETSADAESAINHAMSAVEALHKDSKGNGFRLYEGDTLASATAPSDIAKAVQKALDHNRFQLVFQPIISLRGGDEELYEVFLRMLDDNDELIYPAEFLKEAEEAGTGARIDRWVILETIKMLAEQRAGGHKTRVIVNLTCQSMCDDTLAPWLKVAFQAASLDTDAVIFQVSEQSATSHINDARNFYQAVAAVGCKTSLSNFGCSLSPFATLEHISPDFIKVHGSFTQDIQNKQEGPEVLRALVSQLLELDKVTIASFVENASILSTLWQTGVHYIQGHYLQGPADSMNYDFNMEG